MPKKTTNEAAGAQYTKAQLLASKRYAGRRDAVNALLADDRTYTIDEADSIIENYMKGKVV